MTKGAPSLGAVVRALRHEVLADSPVDLDIFYHVAVASWSPSSRCARIRAAPHSEPLDDHHHYLYHYHLRRRQNQSRLFWCLVVRLSWLLPVFRH